ncbi:MAG: DNA polymerase II large subunit, partial [Candidatus Korarchaeota archaeon]
MKSKKVLSLDTFIAGERQLNEEHSLKRENAAISNSPNVPSPELSEELESYFKKIEASAEEVYSIAVEARKKGLDPHPYPEVSPAEDIAARVEGLLGFEGVANLIREKYGKMSNETLSLHLVQSYIQSNASSLGEEKVAENAIRIGLAFLTGGITTAALEGISKVRIKKNPDGSRYLAIYFASPIRSAGGTEQALTVVMADFARRELGLDVYKPTEEEIERYIEEIHLYERFIGHLQYPSTQEEVRYAAAHVPVEITGEPTSTEEVSGYRNLPRVETNSIRGGAILVLNDGIVGKAPKIYGIIEKTGLKGWEWLDTLIKMREANTGDLLSEEEPKYIKEVLTGRPLFSEPNTKGGFRVRYGRAPNTGLAGVGINPATMYILGEFIAPGTQLKLEGPGKAGVAMPVDKIKGPFVRLDNGDAMFVDDVETARAVAPRVEKILFLGDILITVGEFIENKHQLYPPGYSEEWWASEYKRAVGEEIDPWSIKSGEQALE